MERVISLRDLVPDLAAVAGEILSGVVFQQTSGAVEASCPRLVQKRYLDLILGKSIINHLPADKPRVLTASLAPSPLRHPSSNMRWPEGDSTKHPLNPYYSFSTFVPNASNAQALLTALSVGSAASGLLVQPSVVYFYGNHGVGKTHLLSAIAKLHGTALWLDGQSLRHGLLASIRHGVIADLAIRAQAAQVPGTIIDGIDALEDWPLLQDEFAKQTERYHFPGKFLVISGDKPPEQLRLHPELRTLIQEGVIVRMDPLNEQLRRDILTARLDQFPDVVVPEEVIDTIAEAPVVNGSVLIRIFHKYILSYDTGRPPTTRNVNSILRSCGVSPMPASNTQFIRALAELGTTVSIDQLQGPRPGKEITAIRNSLIHELVETKGLSRSAVARAFKVSVQYVSRIVKDGGDA